MPETLYRASRCCRTLGNPTAYLILKAIGSGRKTPTQLSDDLGMSIHAVSRTLRPLRDIDLVRYEVLGKNKEYWLKDGAVLDILSALEKLVETMRIKRA